MGKDKEVHSASKGKETGSFCLPFCHGKGGSYIWKTSAVGVKKAKKVIRKTSAAGARRVGHAILIVRKGNSCFSSI